MAINRWKWWNQDPFCLCEDGLNIDFVRADSIAETLRYPQDDRCRIQAGILYVLRHNMNNGHTCLPAQKMDATSRMLGVEMELTQSCLEAMIQDQTVLTETFGQGEHKREIDFY